MVNAKHEDEGSTEIATREIDGTIAPKKRRRAPSARKTSVQPEAITAQAELDAVGDPPSEAEPCSPAARGRRKKSDLKHQAILEAAAKVFKNKGYARATLSEIGRKAGTYAGSMYYHFASKEELVEEVLNSGTTGVAEIVTQAVASLPAAASHRTKIRTAYRAHLHHMLLRDDFIVAYWNIINQVPPEVRTRHLNKPRDYGNFWRKLISDGVEAGEIRPGVQQTILRFILVGSSIYALDWYSPRGDMDTDDIADAIIDMLFDGVGQPAAE